MADSFFTAGDTALDDLMRSSADCLRARAESSENEVIVWLAGSLALVCHSQDDQSQITLVI